MKQTNDEPCTCGCGRPRAPKPARGPRSRYASSHCRWRAEGRRRRTRERARRARILRPCEHCAAPFEPHDAGATQRFCSASCRKRAWASQPSRERHPGAPAETKTDTAHQRMPRLHRFPARGNDASNDVTYTHRP